MQEFLDPAAGSGRATRRLLVVGGGHAHVEVLRAWARRPMPGVELVVVSPTRTSPYTGMVPALLNGRVTASDIGIDIEALARRARGRFVTGRLTALDGDARTAWIDGVAMAFDVASLDIGSVPAGLDLPGVTAHALPLRPLDRVLAVRDRVDALPAGARLVVAGGGAAAVEVSLALARRASRLRVALVHDTPHLLRGYPDTARRLAASALARLAVDVHAGRRLTRVADDAAMTDDHWRIAFDALVWATGAAPPPVLAHVTLPRSARGFLHVGPALQALDGSPVFGAGDCVDLAEHPWVPKAGVYAVRQGPVLAHNLRAALLGATTRAYRPQRRALALLDLADGTALAVRGRWSARGRWALTLKDRIDHRFLSRYRD